MRSRHKGGKRVPNPDAARDKQTPTLSANAFETEIRQSRESGMNDHVVKPIDFGLLSRTIEYWGQPTQSPTAARRRA